MLAVLKQPRRRRGFTLIEVLVASGISLLLGLLLVAVFVQSTKALGQTEGRVQLVQSARQVANRLQLLVSAGAYIPGQDTVLYPQPFAGLGTNERGNAVVGDNPDTWYRYMVFATTEDTLASDFDPNEIYEYPARYVAGSDDVVNFIDGYRSEAQRISYYIIWWEDDANGLNILDDEDKVLVIGLVGGEKSGGSTWSGGVETVLPDFRTVEWASEGTETTDEPFSDLFTDAKGDPLTKPVYRVLGRDLEDVTFLKRSDAGIQVSILARKTITAQVGSQTKEFRLENFLQIPAAIAI